MNLSRDIKSMAYLKSNTSDLLKQINETRQPVIITQNGEPRAVLQDPESYENMRNAISLLKLLSKGEEDIKNGKFKSQEDVFAKIESILDEKEILHRMGKDDGKKLVGILNNECIY
ncbi:MAG: type II toxin-antitoxin system Phd/YefM family antitoxin [Candidatus Omnitrophota bacterium]